MEESRQRKPASRMEIQASSPDQDGGHLNAGKIAGRGKGHARRRRDDGPEFQYFFKFVMARLLSTSGQMIMVMASSLTTSSWLALTLISPGQVFLRRVEVAPEHVAEVLAQRRDDDVRGALAPGLHMRRSRPSPRPW